MVRRESLTPDEDTVARAAKYCFRIDREADGHSGEVWDEQGAPLWRYGRHGVRPARTRSNPFRKRDFVFADTDGGAELLIRRASFLPPVFHIVENETIVGRIGLRSALRNKYAIDLQGMGHWTFRLPLFSVSFYGISDNTPGIWALVGPSKTEWNVLVRSGLPGRQLVAALAFIHTEWWNYS